MEKNQRKRITAEEIAIINSHKNDYDAGKISLAGIGKLLKRSKPTIGKYLNRKLPAVPKKTKVVNHQNPNNFDVNDYYYNQTSTL